MPSLTYKQIQDKNLWILDLEDIEKETSKLIVRNRINNKMFSSSKKKFVKNDVLYGKLRPYLDKVLVADEDGICTTEIVPIRIYKDILPEYLRYILKSPFFLNYVNNLTYGVKMPRLGTDDAENALLPIPPLSEQKKIVNILNSTINAIENITLDKEALSNVIKQTKAKVLDLAIKGKLVPQDPNDEPADKLLEKIREEKEKLIKEGKLKRDKNETFIFKNSDDNSYYEQMDGETVCIDDDLPFEIPDSWRIAKINSIAFVTKLAGFEYTKYIANNLCSEGVPLFKGKNIQDGEIIYKFEHYIPNEVSDNLARSQINKKCILLPYVGTIGNVAIHDKKGKFHLGSNVGKIELFNSLNINILEEYVLYFLRSSIGKAELKKHKKATAQDSISIDAIRDVNMLIPPIQEQYRIVEKIKSIFTQLDTMQEIFLQ